VFFASAVKHHREQVAPAGLPARAVEIAIVSTDDGDYLARQSLGEVTGPR
jgi:hypothetical protein